MEVREQCHKFISEIGYSGASDRDSLNRYLPTGYSYQNDMDWEDHSYPTEGTRNCGIDYLFENVPDNDNDLIQASQFYQAEAYKFVVELNRMRSYNNGILLWTMRENWPSFSSAMVDYYGKRKKSFYAVKAANEPVQCMIDIQGTVARCYLINDLMDGKQYLVSICDDNGNVLYSGLVNTETHSPVTEITELSLTDEKLLITEVTVGGVSVRNYRYVYTGKIDYPEYERLYKNRIQSCLL